MKTKIQIILQRMRLMAAVAVLGAGLAYSFSFAAPTVASAAPKDEVCKGVNLGGGSCSDNGAGIGKVIKLAVTILSIVAGVAAVIMIVVGGLKYITSGGDASKVAGAKTTIIYALVGLVIVALAQFIVRYVLGRAV